MKSERNEYFDRLRGLAIIAIVAFHLATVLYYFSVLEMANFSFLFFYIQITAFAVPLFLFISGYFLAKKNIASYKEFRSFLVKQGSKILIPYVIYTTGFIIFDYLTGNSVSLKSIILNYLTGDVVSPYFFVILIFQFYLLLPLLQKINDAKGLLLAAMVNIMYFVILYSGRLGLVPDIFSPYYALFFPAWIFFYQYGLFSAKYASSNKTFMWPWLLIIAILAMIGESLFWAKGSHPVAFAVSQLRFSSFFYSFCLINLLLVFKLFNFNFLTKVGILSMGIFFTHIIILKLLMPFFDKTNISDYQIFYQALVLVLTIVINYYVIVLLRKILPLRVSRALGFASIA